MWDLFGDSSQFYALVEYEKMKETFKKESDKEFYANCNVFWSFDILF